ncbi:DUF4232 domain-containing protein [Pseudonocardia endophytica]|nr:DUF4232 domain-containing protein [Pseudonocardia endophytica]
MRRPAALAALTACLLAGVLAGATGCGAGDELRGALSNAPAPPPVAVSATPGPPSSDDAGGPAGPCTGDRLAVSLGPTSGTGDSVTQDLILQNAGTAACVVRGFPSVVPVAGNEGTQVGDPALPVGPRGAAVRLEPRAAAVVPFDVRDAGSYDAAECRPQDVRGLRILPPGGSGPVFVPREGTACSATRLNPPWATVGTAVAR